MGVQGHSERVAARGSGTFSEYLAPQATRTEGGYALLVLPLG